MKIAVLTSSRADYGIYQTLLKKLCNSVKFDLTIVAFGMHLLSKYGNTINEIIEDNFGIIKKVEGMQSDDSEFGIVRDYAKIIHNFSIFWKENKYDLLICLGDRWEMSAAIQSTIPFQLKIAHIHGGETTLGAIDNIYRHQITLASKFHFTSNEVFSNRVFQLINSSKNVYNVGSLSLENIKKDIKSWNDVKSDFSIPFDDFILLTLHPETVDVEHNIINIKILLKALFKRMDKLNIIITKSNADTNSKIISDEFNNLAKLFPKKIFLVDSLGRRNYISTLKKCRFVIGNSSSGIIEAASFGKWVIDLGKRQMSRITSGNVINVKYKLKDILNNIDLLYDKKESFKGENIYYKKNTSEKIINIISRINGPLTQ